MKTKNLLWFLVIILFLEACNRAITPYQAANNPRGKKCKPIR
jgi:hypothetical protein